jgi:hypothetical protein
VKRHADSSSLPYRTDRDREESPTSPIYPTLPGKPAYAPSTLPVRRVPSEALPLQEAGGVGNVVEPAKAPLVRERVTTKEPVRIPPSLLPRSQTQPPPPRPAAEDSDIIMTERDQVSMGIGLGEVGDMARRDRVNVAPAYLFTPIHPSRPRDPHHPARPYSPPSRTRWRMSKRISRRPYAPSMLTS